LARHQYQEHRGGADPEGPFETKEDIAVGTRSLDDQGEGGDDAVCTATQFIGLVSNQIATMSAFGTRMVSQEEFEGTVRSGVDTFIRAFRLERGK
jgi:hypothetical protein